jgi:hypothetical protein
VTVDGAVTDLYAFALDETRALGIVVESGESAAAEAAEHILSTLWPGLAGRAACWTSCTSASCIASAWTSRS